MFRTSTGPVVFGLCCDIGRRSTVRLWAGWLGFVRLADRVGSRLVGSLGLWAMFGGRFPSGALTIGFALLRRLPTRLPLSCRLERTGIRGPRRFPRVVQSWCRDTRS